MFILFIVCFQEAYRKWVCSSLVPYFAHGGPLDLEPSEKTLTKTRLRPCRSFCQSVEQRCPYLLPGDRAPAYPTQYAGEPTFLCRGECLITKAYYYYYYFVDFMIFYFYFLCFTDPRRKKTTMFTSLKNTLLRYIKLIHFNV